MVGGKGVEGWGVEVGGFGGEVGGGGRKGGREVSNTLFFLIFNGLHETRLTDIGGTSFSLATKACINTRLRYLLKHQCYV
jgi:hypothetical protein